MYIIVLVTCFLLGYHLNYAVHFNVWARRSDQSFVLEEGDCPIIIRGFDIRDDMGAKDCSGKCIINATRKIKNSCNLIHKEGFRYLNVLIDQTVAKTHSGSWSCEFTIDDIEQRSKGYEYFDFDIAVKGFDLSALPKVTELSRLALSEPIFVAPKSSPEHKRVVVINITSPKTEVTNFTLNKGDQDVQIMIPGIKKILNSCNGWCEINNKNISALCSGKFSEETRKTTIIITLEHLKVDKKYSSIWTCHAAPLNIAKIAVTRHINVIVNADGTETWQYCAYAGAACLVLLVIIGHTMCILHFKAKAKKAQMDMNLTPKYTDSNLTSDTTRYVKNHRGSSEVTRESGIYEALETNRERVPPPPPIETLPRSRPRQMRRSMSYSDLINDGGSPRTTPHQVMNRLQHPKNNTFNRFSSMERIKNRPRQPLPTEEVYEVQHMTGAAVEEPSTSRMIPGAGFRMTPGDGFRMPPRDEPRMPPDGSRVRPGAGFRMPPRDETRMPPGDGFRMPPKDEPRMPPDSSRLRPGAGFRMPPRDETRMPSRDKPRMPPGDGFRVPPRDEPRMPPGDGFRMPPRDDTRMTSRDQPRMPPGDGFRTLPRDETRMPPKDEPRMPPDGSRIRPGAGFRKPPKDEPRMPPDGSRIRPGAGFRMPPKDEPRMPPDGSRIRPGAGFRMPPRDETRMPSRDEPRMLPGNSKMSPVEPSQEPGYYNGSSDEEFDTYDVLPDYRIYGNAPPKKFI